MHKNPANPLVKNLKTSWIKNNFYYFENDTLMPRDLDTFSSFLELKGAGSDECDQEISNILKILLKSHFSKEDRSKFSIWLDHENKKHVQNIGQHYCDLVFARFFTSYVNTGELHDEEITKSLSIWLDYLIANKSYINASYICAYEPVLLICTILHA